MILVHLKKKEKGYKTLYFNLKRACSYTLEFDEKQETCQEIPQLFTHRDVETMIMRELQEVQNNVDILERKGPPFSEQQRTDLIRHYASIDYLINYENNNYDAE